MENIKHQTSLFALFVADFERRERFRTATTYRHLLSQFEQWLAKNHIQEFTYADVLTFLSWKKWSNASKNVFLSALRGWSADAKIRLSPGVTQDELRKTLNDRIRLEQIEAIRDYSVSRAEKRALTLNQIKDFLRVLGSDGRTLAWILLALGIRVGELKRIDGIDWESNRIVFKNEKIAGTRVLFFSNYTKQLIHHAVDAKLFKIPDSTIRKTFSRYSNMVHLEISPHDCRHCFATNFAPIVERDVLRLMLGHKPKDVTSLYVHPEEAKIRVAMLEHHYLTPLEPTEG